MIEQQLWLPVAMIVIRHFEASDNVHLNSYIVKGEEHLQATIGWGRAIPLAKHPMTITAEQADRWLAEDIHVRYQKFEKLVPLAVRAKMTAFQVAAFISWSYNAVASCWTSDSFRKLCAGDILGWIDGADEWNNHGMAGLVRRRAVERHLVERGEIERITSAKDLNWYRGLIGIVNLGNKQGKRGHLAWNGDHLTWKLVA